MAADENTSLPSANVSSRIPIHAKVRVDTVKGSNKSSLESELLRLLELGLSEELTAEKVRQIAQSHAQADGSIHIFNWRTNEQHCRSTLAAFNNAKELQQNIVDSCSSFAHETAINKIGNSEEPVTVLATLSIGERQEKLGLTYQPKSSTRAAMKVLRTVASFYQMWQQSLLTKQLQHHLSSLASIVELTERVEACDSIQTAVNEIANQLAKHLDCTSVAIGLNRRGQTRLVAVSGTEKIDQNSEASSCFSEVLNESIMRRSAGIFPVVDQENNHLLISHRKLAQAVHQEAVCSQPMLGEDGSDFGAIVFCGRKETLSNPRFLNFTNAAASRLVSSLSFIQRNEKSRIAKLASRIGKRSTAGTRWLVAAAMITSCFILFLPVTYKIRCNCVAQPISRRFAVAPFDGQIIEGFVKPGDSVAKGQVLAEIDERTFRWELLGVAAKRRQAQRQREMELADRNISKMFLAELESKRLELESKILEFHEANLKIKSPIDGVILSGSLENAEAASVKTGQVLFEIAPTSQMKLEVEIPAEEIGQVKIGAKSMFWLDGYDQTIEGTVSNVFPKSEFRSAKNVFVAEVLLSETYQNVLPGMKGSAKIAGEKKSLGWCLFHKPWRFVQSTFLCW